MIESETGKVKAGRPRSAEGGRVAIALTVLPELADKIDAYAAIEVRSRATMLRILVEEAIAAREQGEK